MRCEVARARERPLRFAFTPAAAVEDDNRRPTLAGLVSRQRKDIGLQGDAARRREHVCGRLNRGTFLSPRHCRTAEQRREYPCDDNGTSHLVVRFPVAPTRPPSRARPRLRQCNGELVVRPGLPTRVSLATRHALAELLGKRDNDALRPADVGYP